MLSIVYHPSPVKQQEIEIITYAILFFSFTIPPPAHGKRKNKCQYLRTKNEFDCFIQTFEKDDPYYTAFLILYFCGLRIGSESTNLTYTILYARLFLLSHSSYATLIFTTHYCELLDLFNRQDNIYIAKSNDKVYLTNMYEGFNIRPELLKSRQFYNNVFQTAVNYDELMQLKKELKVWKNF